LTIEANVRTTATRVLSAAHTLTDAITDPQDAA
jgi:hypothetical protein